MLKALHIQNFIFIDKVHLSLSEGMHAITGESGAGKSILIGALKLSLGEKAGRRGLARNPKIPIYIESEWTLSSSAAVFLSLEGFALKAGDSVRLARFGVEGTLKASLNGKPCAVSLLKALAGYLVDIQSQHAQRTFLTPASQMAILDRYSGATALAKQVESIYETMVATGKKIDNLEVERVAAREEKNALYIILKQFEGLPLDDKAALYRLIHEHERLHHMQSNLEAMSAASYFLDSEEVGVFPSLSKVVKHVERLRGIPESEAWPSLIQEARMLLAEVQQALSGNLIEESLDVEKMAELDKKVSNIYSIQRQHRLQVEELYDFYQKTKERIEYLSSLDLSPEFFRGELMRLQVEYAEHAAALSVKRKAGANALSASVSSLLSRLEMGGTEFQVLLKKREVMASHGVEEVVFALTHKGKPPTPIADSASGGELSRLSLSLYVALSEKDSSNLLPSTMVLDEADSGVSGKASEAMTRLLKELSEAGAQVLAVTHQATLAVASKTHILVEKQERGRELLTLVHSLDKREMRQLELARLVGGQHDSAMQHADTILAHEEGAPEKKERAKPKKKSP